MKNIYRVTRPAWADMDKSEAALILFGTLVLGFYAAWGERFATYLLTAFRVNAMSLHESWWLVDAVVVTLCCLLLIRTYQKLRVRCYPSTFVYCFHIPEMSNPNGKSNVVGYCHVKPNMTNGEIHAEGASFFWENGRLAPNSLVGFRSTHVHGTKEGEEITCNIRYDIRSEDVKKRFYHHGLLRFRLVPTTDGTERADQYAGYMRSTRKMELGDVEVRARGYAEQLSRGRLVNSDLQAVLEEKADVLFAKLSRMLNAPDPPTLWNDSDLISSNKTNFVALPIPTPQSVILDGELYPYIDRLLNKVLALNGLTPPAIQRFKDLALAKARLDENDPVVAYEYDLKQGLVGQIRRRKQDEAMNDRARVVYDEIKPFLVGESLLDIGCGNGLIANLLKTHFKRTQLLDVVNYVQFGLDLEFRPYTEGHPLPVEGSFDTVLLLTVLHHSNEPVELLKLAWGSTKQRLIIIESVIGVHQVPESAHYELATLSDEHQIAYAAFVDWFYNRVLHDNVPVPYNFTTPEKWQSIFVENKMRLIKTMHLGQDIDIGPEYHILFVLEKEPAEQAEPLRLAS